MGERKDVIRSDGRRIPAAENDILVLLEKEKKSVKDRKDLWNKLKNMGDKKGLIGFLQDNHISRMWEIAACKYEHIVDLMARKDADAHVKAVLPGKWIVKTGEITRGWCSFLFAWCSFLFAWARTTEEFPFIDNFEMTISGPVNRKDVADDIEATGGDNSNYYRVVIKDKSFWLYVQRNPTTVPGSVEHCVAAFTFENENNDLTSSGSNIGIKKTKNGEKVDGSGTSSNRSLPKNDQIKVYIRFAGPNVLVGKPFPANWKPANKSENLWGDLVLVKDENN